MLSNFVRQRAQGLLNVVARGFARIGFTPNRLTLVGFFATCSVGFFLATGNFVVGGLLIIATGAFDALDGALARLTNSASKFGAFLDSTTDRFAEGALFLGLLYWFNQRGVMGATYLVYLTLLGSLMVSYARARAEGIGVECKEGMVTRFERIALLVVSLLLSVWFGDAAILIALIILAVLTNVTAAQRIWLVYRATQ
ncbi:MAG: CDP-alcohol phosphatidyltransferase family protein [Chloroflexi bacterium]|nr:CDP-alcohol phosphatidyltransferase family protein [Chloroflexota bacterium]